jgi:hypothetical protein
MDGHAWPIAQWGLTDDEIRRMKEEIRLHPPRLITVSSGEITEIIELYQDRAIDILRKMTTLTPIIIIGPFLLCHFCRHKDHTEDCPYILARQLLEEIDNPMEYLDNGRTTTEIT